MKTKSIVLSLLSAAVVLVVILHRTFFHSAAVGAIAARPNTPPNIQEATATCLAYADLPRIVVLHVSDGGSLSINSEPISDGQLPHRLREIYSARPERILYLFPEKNAPLQRITDVVNVVQHLQEENASKPKVPKRASSSKSAKLSEYQSTARYRASDECPLPERFVQLGDPGTANISVASS
jgi:biopolymer transport protein ExbD